METLENRVYSVESLFTSDNNASNLNEHGYSSLNDDSKSEIDNRIGVKQRIWGLN